MNTELQQKVDRILRSHERGLINDESAFRELVDAHHTIGQVPIEDAERMARRDLYGKEQAEVNQEPTSRLSQDYSGQLRPKLDEEYTLEEAKRYAANLRIALFRAEAILNPNEFARMKLRQMRIIEEAQQALLGLDEELKAAPKKADWLRSECERIEAFVEAQQTVKVKAKPEATSKTERINALIARLAKGDQTAIAELQRLTR